MHEMKILIYEAITFQFSPENISGRIGFQHFVNDSNDGHGHHRYNWNNKIWNFWRFFTFFERQLLSDVHQRSFNIFWRYSFTILKKQFRT